MKQRYTIAVTRTNGKGRLFGVFMSSQRAADLAAAWQRVLRRTSPDTEVYVLPLLPASPAVRDEVVASVV